MRYMFRVLCLGDSDVATTSVVNAGAEMDEFSTDEQVMGFTLEVHSGRDVANVEFLVPRSAAVDYDDILPTTDGVLFYADPSIPGTLELFDMEMSFVGEAGRLIPAVMVVQARGGFQPIPWNLLAEAFWRKYPTYEITFPRRGSSNEAREPIRMLCEAMMEAKVPINLDTAWMRFPVLIDQTNKHLFQGNFELAAFNALQVALLATQLGLADAPLYVERAARLSLRTKNYLQAAQLVVDLDPRRADQYRRLHVDNLILLGDRSFKERRYKEAAERYEQAGNWTKMEMGVAGDELAQVAFERAVEAWISACSFDKSLLLMDSFRHEKKQAVLEKITPRILAAANYMISIGQLAAAKSQLYLVIDAYQREGKFKELKLITEKIREVLLAIFTTQLELEEAGPARLSLDEIENITETFELEPVDISREVVKLAELFIKQADFKIVDELLPRITDPEVKEYISKRRTEREEALEARRKEGIREEIAKGMRLFSAYLEVQQEFFDSLVQSALTRAEELQAKGDTFKAGLDLLAEASKLSELLVDKQANILYGAAVEFLIQALDFKRAIATLRKLPSVHREKVLKKIKPLIEHNARRLYGENGLRHALEAIGALSRIYRSFMLYKAARDFSSLEVKFLLAEAEKLVEGLDSSTAKEKPSLTKEKISEALELVREATTVADAYLDGEVKVEDSFYAKVASLLIDLDELVAAEATLQKIGDREAHSHLHDRILKIESERSSVLTQRAQELVEREMRQEQITTLKSQAREVAMGKATKFRKRKALRRRFYGKPLEALQAGDLKEAQKAYLETTDTLLTRMEHEAAGTCLLLGGLVELVQNSSLDECKEKLAQILESAGTGADILRATFSVQVLEFLIDMHEQGELELEKTALKLLNNLPLFQAEVDLVNRLAGTNFKSLEEVVAVDVEGTTKPSGVAASEEGEAALAETTRAGRAEVIGDLVALGDESDQLQAAYKELESASSQIEEKRESLTNKREKELRIYYRRPLQEIEKGNLSSAASLYKLAAERLTRKDEFDDAGLALALGCLALLHEGKNPEETEAYLTSALQVYGPKKQEVLETVFLKAVVVVIKALEEGARPVLEMVWKFIERFPLLEKEKKLASSLPQV
ncbi:MAG: hypothetical protein Kow0069_23240 [Promethearchaeota archaeon]